MEMGYGDGVAVSERRRRKTGLALERLLRGGSRSLRCPWRAGRSEQAGVIREEAAQMGESLEVREEQNEVDGREEDGERERCFEEQWFLEVLSGPLKGKDWQDAMAFYHQPDVLCHQVRILL